MKIYNYSTKPVEINGNPISDTEIFLQDSLWYASWITHNGVQIYDPLTEPRNKQITIRDNLSTGGYLYEEDSISPPDIWVWVGLMISFFSFYVIVRLIQKIRTR